MKRKDKFSIAFGTDQHSLEQSKEILENLFNVTLYLNDSSFEDGMLYKCKFPGEGHARMSVYENYMPEVDEWKSPEYKRFPVIVFFFGLELDADEMSKLSDHFNFLSSKQL